MYPERPACSALRSLPQGRRAGKGQCGETSCNAPDTKRAHTDTTETEQTTRTHCGVYDTTRNRTPSLIHSFIHTFIHSYTYIYIHSHAFTCIHIHSHAFTCIHMHSHSYIHTFMQRGTSAVPHSRTQRETHVFT